MSTQKVSSFYRVAGIPYLRYLNLSTTYARKATKPTVRSVYGAREQLHYRLTRWEGGRPGPKQAIEEPALK